MDESGSISIFNENSQYSGMTRVKKIQLVEDEIEDLSSGQILEKDAKNFRGFFEQGSDRIVCVLSEDYRQHRRKQLRLRK